MTTKVFKEAGPGKIEPIGEIDGEGIQFSNGRGFWRDATRSDALIQLLGPRFQETPFGMQIDGQNLSNCRITKWGGSALRSGIAFVYDPGP